MTLVDASRPIRAAAEVKSVIENDLITVRALFQEDGFLLFVVCPV
jgi:hypothetical protein